MKNFKFPILLSAMLALIAFASCSDTHNNHIMYKLNNFLFLVSYLLKYAC